MRVNIKSQKIELRDNFKMRRKEMSGETKKRLDAKIASRVCNLWSFREAKTVLAYSSLPLEVGTSELIRIAKDAGKRIALPLCICETHRMEFYIVNDESELVRGAYGIMEPDVTKCEKLTDLSDSVCIVPALAFDRCGYRLGFGKGYYDRFLSSYNGKTIGIIYTDFVVNELPHGRFDKKVDYIVSENRLYSF
ncbi:MAG: 5-formyltetrahydrofolate cyclo-ligase [Clostridia bacterium]|nr:5-formyltetrahydrofolate cyclo-ligase [Clostridia bacterium]